ncbi:MAG: recombinase family protein [Acidimicrobiia bacterium]|nr:recombinase family protein [Acidimicrobiia bacterium]
MHGREFSDNDMSAFKGRRRPGYSALLDAVRAGECDVVVSTEMSRLTRHPRELEDLVDLIEATGVYVSALRAGHIDLSTSGGRVTARILGAMARMESEQMGERIRSKLAANAKTGKPSGGPRPFGYQRVDGRLVVDTTEAKLIEGWAQAILAGSSVSSIVAELNASGIPTVRGGRWTGPTVNQILSSPRMIGMTSSGGEPVAPADWPAILDRRKWEQVKGVLNSRRRGPTPRKTLLAGLVECGLCGARMTGAGRGPNRSRQYVCQKQRAGCGRMTATAGAVDDYVNGVVLGAAELANLSIVRAERHVKDSARLIAEVAEDEQLLNDLAADLGARRIGRAEWISARGPLEERLRENRAALAAVGAGDRLPPDLVQLDDAKWAALSFDQQRAVIALFIDRVTIDPVGNKAGSKFRPERVRASWLA